MKTKLVVLAAAVAVAFGAWAEPTVTDITAKQRYPWNGLVDITCKVSGIEAETGGYEFAVVAVDKDTDREYTVSNFSVKHNGEEVPDVCDNGDYSLLWNARDDMGQVIIERMTVRITLEALAVSVGKVQLWEGGPYWADRNIGAKKPEDSGLYFWWGDTVGYNRVNNAWAASDGSSSYFSFRYENVSTSDKGVVTLQKEGWLTADGVLMPRHDAAHVKWGGSWRMPTGQELNDLCCKCDWTLTTVNDINGYIVCGRGGYASRRIFIPIAGFGASNAINIDSSWYWSSVPCSVTGYTEVLHLTLSAYYYADFNGRYYGVSIRPVQ